MSEIKQVDYKCRECGAQGVQYKARVFVNHDPGCDLLAWLQNNTNLIHLKRGGDDEYAGGPWDGT